MTTVFDGLMAIAQRLPRSVRGIATAGGEDENTWLYVDDLLDLVDYADNTFIRGTLLIETGDCAGAVLPVRDSIQTSGRVLGEQRWWVQGVTEQEIPEAGDIYLVTCALYGPAQLVLGLREALRSWGWAQVRESAGTGDGTTKAFTQTTPGEITRIFLINEDGDDVTEYVFWEATATGVVFSAAPPAGYTIEATIRYPAEDVVIMPPSRATFEDELGDIPAPFLGYYGAYATVRASLGAPGQDQDLSIKVMNYYAEQAEAARGRYQGSGIRGRERFVR